MKRVLAMLTATMFAGAAAAGGPACDRACLSNLATRTVDALAQRGASAALPWAPRVGYSENGVPMMVEDGIWATVTAHGAAPLMVADPTTHAVAWIGAIEEHGQPAFLAMDLHADGSTIAAVHNVIRRKEGRPPFADPTSFAFADMGARADRASRARLAAAAQAFYAPGARPRLLPTCVHTENGVTQPGACLPPSGVEATRGLRVVAVDEARGLVAVSGMRDYTGASTRGTPPADAPFPHSYAFLAVLRIEGGGVARIQEVSSAVPYRMPVPEQRP